MKKTALITGASCELGQSLIENLKEEYNLILFYKEHELNSNLSSIAQTYKCDLNNDKEVSQVIENIKQQYNKIDLIINLAARSNDLEKEDITNQEFLTTLNINVVAPFILIQKLLKEDGTAINIASTDGIDTFNEYNLTYATSKAALIHETKQLALMYQNAHIYALALNYINTKTTREMNPHFLKAEMERIHQNKLLEISDIIDKINILLKDKPQSGQIIRMD